MATRAGRRPRAGERSTERIEFVVTRSERADLEHVAKENRVPLSGLIRDAVNEYVADYRESAVFLVSASKAK